MTPQMIADANKIVAQHGFTNPIDQNNNSSGRFAALNQDYQNGNQNSGNGGNFITNNLNTAGGIGGGLLGLALAPETGGLSAVAIPALMAALGQAGGEVAKQQATGRQLDTGEVGKQALIGGASDLGGQALAGVLGKVGGMLGGVSEKAGQAVADTNAAKIGDAIMSGPNFVSKSVQKNVLDHAPADGQLLFGDLGYKSLQDVADHAPSITGKAGFGTTLQQSLAQAIPKVETGATTQIGQDILDKTALSEAEKSQVMSALRNHLDGLNPDLQGVASGTNTAGVIKELNSAKFGIGGGDLSPIEKAQKQVYDAVAAHLDNQYGAAGANKIVAGYTPSAEEQAAIRQALSSNPAAADHYIQALTDAKTPADIRAASAPYVRASQAADQVATAGATGGGLQNGVISGSLPRTATQIVTKPLGAALDAAAVPAAKGLSALGGAISGINPTLADALTAGAKGAINVGLQGATGPQASNQSPSPLAPPDPTDPTQQAQQGQGQQIGLQQVLQAMAKDPKNASLYKEMYQLQQSSNKANNLTPAQQKDLLAANNGLSLLDTVQQHYQSAGGGQGLVGGSLSNALGGVGLNNKVQIYNQSIGSAVAQIAKAISGSSRLPTKQTIDMVKGWMPLITDNPQVAAGKLQNIQDQLNAVKQNIQGAPGATSNLNISGL